MDVSGMNCCKRRKIRSDCSAKADARQIAIQPKIIRHDLPPMTAVRESNSTDISMEGPFRVCAVKRRRFPVGASPTRQTLQPEATGAVMEVTKWLKPLVSVSRIGDSASVQAAT